jgi:hypothetical protein
LGLISRLIADVESKDVKTGFHLAESSEEGCDSKWVVLRMMVKVMLYMTQKWGFTATVT